MQNVIKTKSTTLLNFRRFWKAKVTLFLTNTLLRHFSHCHALSLSASINLLLGLSHFFFPGSTILSILLPIYPSSFLHSCPNHLSLAWCFLFKPALSLWCTHSWSCPFLSLLMEIVTSSTLPPPSPVSLSVPPSPTRTTLQYYRSELCVVNSVVCPHRRRCRWCCSNTPSTPTCWRR